jgi:hypothetical protein
MLAFAVVLALTGMPLLAAEAPQNNPPGAQAGPPPVSQSAVDEAIKKGIAYLKANNAAHMARREHAGRQLQNCELVLWTYIHSGVGETDPAFQELFEDMMKRKLEATYCVSLQAMILEELERVKYQGRIVQCGQFLVDNQSAQGFWGYGDPTIYAEDVPTTAPKKDVASGGGKGPKEYDPALPHNMRAKPPVKNRVPVKKMKDGNPNDNSNTQYACLGMRACHDAGVILPKEVIENAIKWFRGCQKDDKNVKAEPLNLDSKMAGGTVPGATVAGQLITAEPQGWCYQNHADHKAYGSMTAGAIGCLSILDYIKDNDDGKKKTWRSDKDVHEGLQWISKNFSVTGNPGPYEHANFAENGKAQYYYYLYALERAGMLYGTEIIGSHWWYQEGANQLIKDQAAGGSWGDGAIDTCFAILFLRRATRPLVATQAASGPRK